MKIHVLAEFPHGPANDRLWCSDAGHPGPAPEIGRLSVLIQERS
jgi:hypothetical protein